MHQMVFVNYKFDKDVFSFKIIERFVDVVNIYYHI